MGKNQDLTPKQKRFIEEYTIDMNATRAAIRAGYSQKTAYSIGQELLTKPEISAAIAQIQAARAEKTGVTAEWGIMRLRDVHDRAMSQSKPDYAAANRALELLGKHSGMFTDRLDITAKLEYEIRLPDGL